MGGRLTQLALLQFEVERLNEIIRDLQSQLTELAVEQQAQILTGRACALCGRPK